jgi:hypothetical protein
MTRFSTLPIPLTLESLQAVPEGNLLNELWDYYLDLVENEREKWQATGEMIEPRIRDFDRTLSRGMRLVLAYHYLYGDVLNGGIQQFFYNHTPRQITEIFEGLKAVGAVDAAHALSRAIAIYTSKYAWPTGSDDRWLEGSPEDLEDEELNAIPLDDSSSQRDYEILERYLREHLDEVV